MRCTNQTGREMWCHVPIDPDSHYVVLENGKDVLCEPCVDNLIGAFVESDRSRARPKGMATRRSAPGAVTEIRTRAA